MWKPDPLWLVYPIDGQVQKKEGLLVPEMHAAWGGGGESSILTYSIQICGPLLGKFIMVPECVLISPQPEEHDMVP